jgi:hypothetical protein
MESYYKETNRVIKGLDKFKEYFENYKEQYVLIGGAACDLILSDTLIPPRATKDLDVVLVVEALTSAFAGSFGNLYKMVAIKTDLKMMAHLSIIDLQNQQMLVSPT